MNENAKELVMRTNILKISFILLVIMAVNTLPAIALEIKFSANDEGLKLITEKDVAEQFGRGLPMGPSSARFSGEDLWVVDSVGGKFISYDSNGNSRKSFSINKGKDYIFADFAFQTNTNNVIEYIWAIGSEETNLLKIAPDGKVVAEFVTTLIRPQQIEVVANRHIVIYDHGQANLVAYDMTGKELWQQQVAAAGFVVTADNEIICVKQNDDTIKVCQSNPDSGQDKILCEFPISLEAEPRLLLLNDSQHLLLSFHMFIEGAEEATYQIARLSLADAQLQTTDSPFPAAFLNRILLTHNGKIFIVNFVGNDKEPLLRIDEFKADFSARQSEG